MKRLRAGINAGKRMFEYVFSDEVREKIASVVEIDFDSLRDTPDEYSIAASLEAWISGRPLENPIDIGSLGGRA